MKRPSVMVALATAVMACIAATSASAAQRNYTIVGGTTTITLANDWLQVLSDAGYSLSAANGASITQKTKGTDKVVALRFPVVRSAGNVLASGTSQGDLVQYKHRGAMRITAPDGTTVTFTGPQLSASRPKTGANTVGAVIPESTVRDTQTFFTLGNMSKLRKPSRGHVRLSFGAATFMLPGGVGDRFGGPWNYDTVDGTFPSAAGTLHAGTVASDLRVKK